MSENQNNDISKSDIIKIIIIAVSIIGFFVIKNIFSVDIKHLNTTECVNKLNSLKSEEVINILGKPDDVVQMVDYKIYRYISDDDRVFFEKDESGKDENLYVRISYDGYVISVGN